MPSEVPEWAARRDICGHQVLAPAQVYGRPRARRRQFADHPRAQWVLVPGAHVLLQCLEEPGHDGDHRHAFVWSNRGQPGDSPK